MTFRWTSALLCATVVASACSENEPMGIAQDSAPAFGLDEAGRIGVYNAGLPRSVPGQPCMNDPKHREFDFWLGEWSIAGGGGGDSKIESLLDGCVVLEQYQYTAGITGRSINAYDPDTGEWHQTWISGAGSFPSFGHLRMHGTRTGDVLSMSGLRVGPFGRFVDNYSWTDVSENEAIQAFTFSNPFVGTGGNSLTYIRTTGLVLGPQVANPACRSGGGTNNRVLDFMHGSWDLQRENGLVLGTAQVTAENGGCVTQMRYTTRKGYEAIAYTYFDPTEWSFFRTYIDSEGERIELKGFVFDGALVLNGVEKGDDGATYPVRVVIRDDTADQISETWQISSDNGATWETDLVVRFVRQ